MPGATPLLPEICPAPGDELEELLDAALAVLREREGVDLSGHRRTTLLRRLRNRMISAGASGADAYLARLRSEPGEAPLLLDRLTVKVSRFFRNRSAAEAIGGALAAEVARTPRTLAAWSAGCGRGEEPYTLAILLAELGQPAAPPAVLATDVDAGALAAGRLGRYAGDTLAEAPLPARERWFEAAPTGRDGVAVVPELRRRVRFERHDLARDPPPGIAAFDLVTCRNTLIYFAPALQRRALEVLCAALRPGGLLWLGEAEWPPPALEAQLAPVDRQARLFRLSGGGAHA